MRKQRKAINTGVKIDVLALVKKGESISCINLMLFRIECWHNFSKFIYFS